MFRRPIISFTLAIVVMLVLVAPAQAGGWAVVTLDSLPGEVRAGQSISIGFTVRQHGRTPTNRDLDGKPLQPVLIASKQASGGETVRVTALQDGAVGHFVADVTFPSDGTWAWQIEVPTYVVQNSAGNFQGSAVVFEPLSVLPSAGLPSQFAVLPGVDRAALRWSALIVMLLAIGAACYVWLGRSRSRRMVRTE